MPRLGKFRVFEGEEDGFEGFQRGFVLFSLHLEIRHPVRSRERPGILNLGIRIHFGLAEAHIFAHAVGEIVIHDRVGEISVGAEIGQRIVRDEVVGGDIEQRIGRRVGGQAERCPVHCSAQKSAASGNSCGFQPHWPNVWPKSASDFGIFHLVATSKNPATPTVVLQTNR